MNTSLTLGFSPCPNDTFIFEALVNRRIESPGFLFHSVIKDVEELNRLAFEHSLDVTKVSFAAYLRLVKDFVLLNAGAALGRGCGPLLVSKEEIKGDMSHLTVAIPGVYTTANLLLGFAFPELKDKRTMLFSEIEDSVVNAKVDLGLIIHESRFTFQDKGLVKVADLGEVWERKTGHPIPLGGIIARRGLGVERLTSISNLIRSSLEYAYAYPDIGKPYIKSHAQETEEAVIQKHIDLYVNDYSRDLGIAGRSAITALFDYARQTGIIDEKPESVFLS